MEDRKADLLNGAKRLLGRDDPPPFSVTNPQGSSPVVFIGDHAGRAVPQSLNGLGVPPVEMDRHIAWDIGVAGLGGKLAARMDATFIRQTYSRLVIDCNRTPGVMDDAMPVVSDGTPIPGNLDLTEADKAARVKEIFTPYQNRIAAELDARAGRSTVLVSLHSFTPVMKGFVRPWRYGVLHMNNSGLSRRMLALLQTEFGEAAGDNQPYAMDGIDHTIPFHCGGRGLDYLEIETRQDLIADEAGQEAAADVIARLLEQALKP